MLGFFMVHIITYMRVKVRSYHTAIALPCRTANSCDLLHCGVAGNLKCSDAAVTCGRDVIDISAPKRNSGVV